MRKDRQKEIMAQLEAEKRASRKVKGIAFFRTLAVIYTIYRTALLAQCTARKVFVQRNRAACGCEYFYCAGDVQQKRDKEQKKRGCDYSSALDRGLRSRNILSRGYTRFPG